MAVISTLRVVMNREYWLKVMWLRSGRLLPVVEVSRMSVQQLDNAGVSVEVNSGSVRIDVGEQQFRHIASISMPYVKVDFEFNNVSEADRVEFMRYFDLRYQRGGG